MTAHQTPAPMTEGEAGFGAGQTPASPTVPLGEAGPHFSDADAVGAPASEGPTATLVTVPPIANTRAPRWASVDDNTSTLLDLITAHPEIPSKAEEWEHFRKVLAKVAAENDGLIDQNRTRPLLRGEIAPRRVGAYFHRAACRGLIRAEGWTTSDDREGKNSGRPCRSYRYLGT